MMILRYIMALVSVIKIARGTLRVTFDLAQEPLASIVIITAIESSNQNNCFALYAIDTSLVFCGSNNAFMQYLVKNAVNCRIRNQI